MKRTQIKDSWKKGSTPFRKNYSIETSIMLSVKQDDKLLLNF